ncbi:putative UV radiation resistance protein (UVRAG) [Aspergillus lucknowensis]|uniref:UV radiation resistance protein and autophagy-related subunit 14-domain-containing protein n=1 Tax=Aspergillus lucknowensis TaxID=176173 RepID=A0ABR4LP40_9EURO
MATANTSVGLSNDDGAGSRRERPVLLPSSRKLRHLQGVSVRNLVVDRPNRSRGKTIDDEDIPNSLQSPSKILAQDARRSLNQSRSFSNLKFAAASGEQSTHHERLPSHQARRKSTLPWSDPNPQIRQVKLEDITRSRMATTWFSIHCDGIAEPVYISEIVEDAMNPNFRAFDLNFCGPLVSRRDHLTLRLWVKTAAMDDYMVLVELQLHLRSLQFLGRSLDSFHQPLPANSILLHFPDGVYTNLTDIPPVWAPYRTPNSKTCDSTALPTSSYDALMRLANLDECIQDALITRERLESQINSILEKNLDTFQTTSDASRAQDKLALTRTAVSAERKQLRLATKRKEELIASIKARKDVMERGSRTQDRVRSHLPDARVKLGSSTKLLDQNTEETKGQIRRISEDLQEIYPIEPIPEKPLAFTISGLALPNSNFTDVDRDAVAAGLGYTAHLVYLLSFYLSIPVPYPITPYLSNSLILDPVSTSLPQRTYPLHPVSVQYRFEYGVFLLNKDIEFLLNKQGLRVLDIRHTLPNLKYLLYVLTARSSEIPARKAGGIRGLLPGRLTPSLSRRGSEDSVVYGETINPRRGMSPISKANGEVAPVGGRKPIAAIPSASTSFQAA